MKPECATRRRLLETAMALIWENSYGTVSVDDICRHAEVKKGSFYYFFPSKSELTVAAMEADWQAKQPVFDGIFSPQVAPLERLERFCALTLDGQSAKRTACGKVCGCPMMTLGAELSTQDEAIRAKAAEILGRYVRYLESALRDAQADGVVSDGDPRELAEQIFALCQGALLHARVTNDLAPLRRLSGSVRRMVGASPVELPV
jgi:TetR/AcrR family transcriptional repressor of nem operon